MRPFQIVYTYYWNRLRREVVGITVWSVSFFHGVFRFLFRFRGSRNAILMIFSKPFRDAWVVVRRAFIDRVRGRSGFDAEYKRTEKKSPAWKTIRNDDSSYGHDTFGLRVFVSPITGKHPTARSDSLAGVRAWKY